MVLLLTGIWAGLIRIGWQLPTPQPSLAGAHGPLLVCGVLGTMIGFERAVALRRRWSFAAPALSGVGGLLLLAGQPVAGAVAITAGSLVLLAVFGVIVRLQPARFTVTMALGAVAWASGNLLWLASQPMGVVALWWAGFLVLTIAGERLELGRLRQLPRSAMLAFAGAVAITLVGLVLSVVAFDTGARLVGVGYAALALWLIRYDIAWRTIHKQGLPRFSAICILSGSAWLLVGGMIGAAAGGLYAGPLYDALLHAILVGFVFAMVFGHAPIVVPALLKVPLPFEPRLYVPLVLLHASLLLRVGADLAGQVAARRWGGMLNAIALLLFMGLLALTARQARQQ